MAQSKFQKSCKSTPVLKRLANFILIFFLVAGGIFLFFAKKEDLDKSEQKKLEIKTLIDYQQIIESTYRWEIITQEGYKIILDPNQDITKQINLVKEVLLKEKIENLEYIGVDTKGQIYFK